MSEQEKRIIETYKEAVEFYNFVKTDNDRRYADAQVDGMKEMAEAFGYILYAHHKCGLIGGKYDYITLAKDGKVLVEVPV